MINDAGKHRVKVEQRPVRLSGGFTRLVSVAGETSRVVEGSAPVMSSEAHARMKALAEQIGDLDGSRSTAAWSACAG